MQLKHFDKVINMISHTLSKTEFLQFQTAFRARANARNISSSDLVLYNLVRGKSPKNGFTEITNKIKINNGAHRWTGFHQAKYNLTCFTFRPQNAEAFKKQWTIKLTEEQFAAFQAILNGA